MSRSSCFPKNIVFLFCLQVIFLLAGCGSSGDNNSISEIQASTLEGPAPLGVTFDISKDDNTINQVAWTITWDFGDGTQTTDQFFDSASAYHTFTAPGSYTVTATIINTTETIKKTTTITVTSSSNPDSTTETAETTPSVNLIVSSFAMDDRIEISDGSPDIETISAIIQNIGTSGLSGTGYLHVGYYLSIDKAITADDIYIGDTTIVVDDDFTKSEIPFGFESLSPGQNYQYNHQLFLKTNIPSGTYYVGAFVDYIDEYNWYIFPRATDTQFDPEQQVEYEFPVHIVVQESDENDNTRISGQGLGQDTEYQVTVSNTDIDGNPLTCSDDIYEGDDTSKAATSISNGDMQHHNFCNDNSDWLKFEATAGNIYRIRTCLEDGNDTDCDTIINPTVDTQLILYDQDASTMLLFSDNLDNGVTVDLSLGWPLDPLDNPARPFSEIVWEAQTSGTYFIKVRSTACDEDQDHHCSGSPKGAGLKTEYKIRLDELSGVPQ